MQNLFIPKLEDVLLNTSWTKKVDPDQNIWNGVILFFSHDYQ